MRVYVDVGMVEGGEGHIIDALFHRGYPYHRRVTKATEIVLVVA